MSFKEDFLAALQSGRDDAALLKMVRDYQSRAHVSPRDAYEALHGIWQEFGFDERSDGCAFQNSLEYVMEKTWYECPATESPT